jgi:hypothetical protein
MLQCSVAVEYLERGRTALLGTGRARRYASRAETDT